MMDYDTGRELPPMPAATRLYATLRNDQPVARITFTDPVGDTLELDFTPETLMDLLVQSGKFIQQTGLGTLDP